MTLPHGLACRVCGSTAAEKIGDDVSRAPDARVYRCRACSLVYLFPIMNEAEEAEFYRTEFETYMSGRWKAGWTSAADHFRAFQAEGERRLPLVRPFLHAADRVLEIGSSTGYFLDDLRGSTASVTGVEPSEDFRAYANARGIETVGDIGDLAGRTFDAILLYYVVEHLRNPVAYLRDLANRLEHGGRLLIEVPNVEDALIARYAIPAFPAFYWQKAHYHNFSQRTLADVLIRAGLDAEVLPVQRYDLSNHMVWMMEGKPGGAGRFAGLLSREVEIAYAEALKRAWACDTVFAIGRKRAS